MKYCVHCGKELTDEATVCENCGQAAEPIAPEAPKKEELATSPVSISTVLGIVGLASQNLYATIIMSIIGIILGAKEQKATGKKLGLVLNILALSFSAVSIIGIFVYLFLYFFFVFITFFAAL